MDSLDPSAGEDQLSRGRTACADNGLSIVHDEDVVPALEAFFGVAHVFQVVHGVFLAVHIVGKIAVFQQLVHAVRDHFRRRVVGISVALSKEACGALNGESMDSDALRREVHHSVKTIPEALEALCRESGDKVGVYVVKAQLSGSFKGRDKVSAGVPSADHLQYIVVESLSVDGDPGSAQLLDHSELFLGYGVRTAGLEAVFPDLVQVEILSNALHDRAYIAGLKGGRSTAAEVDRIDPSAVFFYQTADDPQLPAEGIDVLRHELDSGVH